MIKVSSLVPHPENPRFIKDSKFEKLVESIRTFPEMMAARPMIADKENVIWGGNMRLNAIKHLGIEEIPDEWVERVYWPEEKLREFMIKDNLNFGEWNMEDLANTWDHAQLDSWGVDVPKLFIEEPSIEEPQQTDGELKWILKIEVSTQQECEELSAKLTSDGYDVKIENKNLRNWLKKKRKLKT